MAPDLGHLLERERAGFAEELRAHLDLADVVERRRPPQGPDPLAIPPELAGNGLGKRGDAGAVTETPVALLERACE
jgi:hypothetical protein